MGGEVTSMEKKESKETHSERWWISKEIFPELEEVSGCSFDNEVEATEFDWHVTETKRTARCGGCEL